MSQDFPEDVKDWLDGDKSRVGFTVWKFPWGSAWISTIQLPVCLNLPGRGPAMFETMGAVVPYDDDGDQIMTDAARRFNDRDEARSRHILVSERLKFKDGVTMDEALAVLENELERNE